MSQRRLEILELRNIQTSNVKHASMSTDEIIFDLHPIVKILEAMQHMPKCKNGRQSSSWQPRIRNVVARLKVWKK